MSFRSYNPHQRYKERAAHRLSSFLMYLALILIAGLAGFWLGRQYGAEQLITAQAKVESLLELEKEQQEKITELSALAQTASARFEQLKETVENTTPIGKARDLIQIINKELDSGADPERIAFLVQSGRPPTDCIEPDTKRFVVSTPLYKGPSSEVDIVDGGIKISASGVSARGEGGKPQVWYDPQQSIEVSFQFDENKETKKGLMPIRNNIIFNDREYRFTIEAGAQSFAKVTYDSCAYP